MKAPTCYLCKKKMVESHGIYFCREHKVWIHKDEAAKIQEYENKNPERYM